jgi:hypothetical protein
VDRVRAYATARGLQLLDVFSVYFVRAPAGANWGETHWCRGRVTTLYMRADLSPEATFETAVHELVHAALAGRGVPGDEEERRVCAFTTAALTAVGRPAMHPHHRGGTTMSMTSGNPIRFFAGDGAVCSRCHAELAPGAFLHRWLAASGHSRWTCAGDAYPSPRIAASSSRPGSSVASFARTATAGRRLHWDCGGGLVIPWGLNGGGLCGRCGRLV